MELEPGRIVREQMPLGPRISRDGLFTGYTDWLDDMLSASDPGLAGVSARVGDGVPTDLDGAYDGTVGRAADAHAAQVRGGSGSIADSLIGSGGNVDTLRGSVLGYLPQPDAPIDTSFTDPPDGGVAHTGRGFDTPGKGGDGGDGNGNGKGGDGGDGNGRDKSEAAVRARVRALYLELLDREPDPSGWDAWSNQILDGVATIEDVRAAIVASDEYKQLHGG